MGSDILTHIVAQKWREIARAKQQCPPAEMQRLAALAEPVRGFRAAMFDGWQRKQAVVIAEIKKASPSKGVIRSDFDPAQIAKSYQSAGAACLSILTDEQFFQGHKEHLKAARAAVSLPVIRKDFMLDPYQVYEARAMNADCILLVVGILDDTQLIGLNALAKTLSMDVLVEVHNVAEMERARRITPDMMGINNRDLHTFEVSLDTTLDMRHRVDEKTLLVTESGIRTRADVATMLQNNIYGFLVGEAFMRDPSPGDKLHSLFGSS